jgi:hypothetical protein
VTIEPFPHGMSVGAMFENEGEHSRHREPEESHPFAKPCRRRSNFLARPANQRRVALAHTMLWLSTTT